MFSVIIRKSHEKNGEKFCNSNPDSNLHIRSEKFGSLIRILPNLEALGPYMRHQTPPWRIWERDQVTALGQVVLQLRLASSARLLYPSGRVSDSRVRGAVPRNRRGVRYHRFLVFLPESSFTDGRDGAVGVVSTTDNGK